LVEPILTARPQLVVVSAPSGYGKTVLAAQVAAAGVYSDVAWIGGSGESSSVRDALAGLARHLVGASRLADEQSLPELCHRCSEELAALPDGDPVLVVVDDVAWAADPESLRVLAEVFSETPLGSSVLVTTRADASAAAASRQAWLISADQLMLTDGEIAETWERLACRGLADAMASEVAAASGRHVALVSLMARHAAFLDGSVTRIECTPSISSLINELVAGELSEADSQLLDYAAVLREAGIESLCAASGRDDAAEGLSRIAAALPLVSPGAAGRGKRFSVHALVSEARGSVAALADRDPVGLGRAVDELCANGSTARALEVAIASGLEALIARQVTRSGAHLLKGASWEVVRAALDALPAEVVASEPALLLVRAEADWNQYSRIDALQQAKLAMRLAELSGDGSVPPAARALLAGMRMATADFSGAISDLAPFLDARESRDADDMADALYAAVAAYAFLADREGFTRTRAAAHELISSSDAAGSRLARLELALGIVSEIVDGDSQTAGILLASSAARMDVPAHRRAIALCNSAITAFETGDLGHARKAHAEAAMVMSACSTALDHALFELIGATIDALDGSPMDVREVVDRVLLACEAEGEAFTFATTCAMGTQTAIFMGQVDYARELSERGLRQSAELGSPVLTWLAELAHAHALLAIGDVERARATAERVLPQVEPLGLMGHVLRARMILAQVALHDGKLASAVQHLSIVADHIVETSPVFVVGSHLRAFPDMLGPLALTMGVDHVPIRILDLMRGRHITRALDAARTVLTTGELTRLSGRVRADAEQPAIGGRASESDGLCQVRMFGGLEVTTPHGVVAQRDWGKRKARLLFAMLVARHGTDVHRAELIEYLWPDLDEAHGINNFYVVWSAMKRAVSPGSPDVETVPPFENHNGVCRMIPGRVASDLDQFTAARAEARYAKSIDDTQAEATALRTAIELYRGDVLPGDIYDDWFGSIRQRFRQEYQASVIRFSTLMLAAGDPLAALPFVIGASERDSLREDLYQVRIKLEVASNQRGAAMGTYMSCRNTLIEELGIDPSRETVELYQQILAMEEGPETFDGGSRAVRNR
jgi:DNA-binding SARP family transcriptional activator/ATP/maltotriose-dependent transcriptional regulator MalT